MARPHSHNFPYSPSEKERAVKMLATSSPEWVAHRFHCSIRSLYRWRRKYDGTAASLSNLSHRPLTPCKRALTEEEARMILRIVKRHRRIGLSELYGKLLRKGFCRNVVTLYRFLRRRSLLDVKRKERYRSKPYNTPTKIGIKMQMDVKVVPFFCRSPIVPGWKNFYQYTIIDECSRERFIFAYDEQCAFSTCDFVKRAIAFFGYKPAEIQTDNGQEFTYTREASSGRVHPLDSLCSTLGITHKLIKPRTPRHNGKVERSHRSDNERFYSCLSFYSLSDLRRQMHRYLLRSNAIPMSVLGWKSPSEVRKEHECDLM